MTPETSFALPSPARISTAENHAAEHPQTTSNATAVEAGLRDAPGSPGGSSGWSSTEPTDGAVHGAATGGPARHSSTTPGTAFVEDTPVEDTVAFWETQALRLTWETTPGSAGTNGGRPWHTAHLSGTPVASASTAGAGSTAGLVNA